MASSSAALAVTASSGSSLAVSIHPLPILNISDHWTRTQMQRKGEDYKIVGALLGIQKGTEVEIVNTFEIAITRPSERMEVDGAATSSSSSAMDVEWPYFEERKSNYKQVFPTLDFLGWYSIGSDPTALDLAIHKQFYTLLDSPLFVMLSPTPDPKSEDIPLRIFETSTVPGKDGFGEVSKWRIETGEAERIAVEGVASAGRESGADGGEGSLTANLTTQQNAIQMLSDRINTVLEYVRGVEAGIYKKDHGVLREISSLISMLPASEESEFREEFNTEYTDVQLTGYLSALTKGLYSLNATVDKFNLVNAPSDRQSSGIGMGNMKGMGGGRRGFGRASDW